MNKRLIWITAAFIIFLSTCLFFYITGLRVSTTCLYAATYGAVALYPEQRELSAIGAIPGSQVIGTYPVKGYQVGEFIPNPNYRGAK